MAATGTPTTNIGLRRPQGTDPASVDDINYNSEIIDTKLGAVGSTSVQEQINTLNSKLVPTQILESGYPLASSETSYNCNWSQYNILIFAYCFYSNILMTNVVPMSEFASTSNGRFVYLANDQSIAIRKNGNNAVYISYSGSNTHVQVKIFGVL